MNENAIPEEAKPQHIATKSEKVFVTWFLLIIATLSYGWCIRLQWTVFALGSIYNDGLAGDYHITVRTFTYPLVIVLSLMMLGLTGILSFWANHRAVILIVVVGVGVLIAAQFVPAWGGGTQNPDFLRGVAERMRARGDLQALKEVARNGGGQYPQINQELMNSLKGVMVRPALEAGVSWNEGREHVLLVEYERVFGVMVGPEEMTDTTPWHPHNTVKIEPGVWMLKGEGW